MAVFSGELINMVVFSWGLINMVRAKGLFGESLSPYWCFWRTFLAVYIASFAFLEGIWTYRRKLVSYVQKNVEFEREDCKCGVYLDIYRKNKRVCPKITMILIKIE